MVDRAAVARSMNRSAGGGYPADDVSFLNGAANRLIHD